jgi:prephenate dehydrogenase
MLFKQIAIIGSDYVSVSIALKLKTLKEPPEIIGYDAKAFAADLARAKGAFDQVERRPGRACKNADLVIVAVPLTDVRDTFATIAPHLKAGAFVTDTAPLKAPVMHWAEELLPEGVYFAGGHPILNPAIVGLEPVEGLDEASADLLREALYCFTTPSGISDAVLDVFARLARMLDANPFFIDVTEHDGMQAGIENLPELLSIALLRATIDTPGWREMRKFAGYRFALATEAAEFAHQHHVAMFLNRENVVRRLNVLLTELIHIRDLLSQDDEKPLEEAFAQAVGGREQWMVQRGQGMWIKDRAPSSGRLPSESLGKQVRQMFLGERFGRRLKDGQNPDSE